MRESGWRIGFQIFNYAFLGLIAISCVLPIIHVLALSLSSNAAASAGVVRLWPVGFNTMSYEYVLEQAAFIKSIVITLQRVAIGVSINILLTVLLAYPLSKEAHKFKSRTVYAWIFVFTMLFGGGLIPTYMVVRTTGLLDSIWALVLPGAVPVFSAILLLNFFRGLPKELEEAAFIDGAGHFVTLFRIYLPLSVPAIATILLLSSVGHWNSWFDGLIYMNSPERYPLQSYLQTIVIQKSFSGITDLNTEALKHISDRTVKAAQIFLGALPVLLLYPFLQKYFMQGIVMGSVKE
ncbi:carbohydrate ABC transporter permease [Cohnella abietis]|uniref:ABC transporter permease n=1 Tax=Cohnella abietis TaxID=2507935 RepID=A0A3T1DEI9_9BACL|nr:carbohydrate ABC transporter permease [Cohnella abietis]BBI36540.1 ABC transporter permease [Cohnella abietis]